MKIFRGVSLIIAALASRLICWAGSEGALGSLEVAISHRVGADSLQMGSLRYENKAREKFSVTRVSYLLSDFALLDEGGSWIESTDSVAWIDAEKGRTSFRLRVPPGSYQAIRFSVGLNRELNHADIARFPAGHPLNPNLNGLHWSWQGGYVFMALEGIWRDKGAYGGWSYHLARDTNRTSVTLPVSLEIAGRTRLELEVNLLAALDGPHPLCFDRDGSSTHSRDGDPVSAALVANLPSAFSVRRISHETERTAGHAAVTPLYLPEKFTPYRFRSSASFPMPNLPRDNPLIAERVALGEKLFNARELSRDGSISCASCHQWPRALSDGRRFSGGVENRLGTRNAMPLFNLAWKSSFFWDGRAASLREQALMPIQNHLEMDQSLPELMAKLGAKSLTNEFARAFGSTEITAEKIGLALEQFLLTLTSFDSKFDRAMRGEAELTAEEKRGFELFSTEYDPRRGQFGADCFHCHGGALFQSQTFANNGLDTLPRDSGRAGITGRPEDSGKFATPSLRNIELTAPYMHDGRFGTLAEVIEHYGTGMQRSATLDPNLAKHPEGGLHLSTADKSALLAFLKTLTDPRFSDWAPSGNSGQTGGDAQSFAKASKKSVPLTTAFR